MKNKTALQTKSSQLFGKKEVKGEQEGNLRKGSEAEKKKSAAANLKRSYSKRVSAENVREYGMKIQLHNKDSEISE